MRSSVQSCELLGEELRKRLVSEVSGIVCLFLPDMKAARLMWRIHNAIMHCSAPNKGAIEGLLKNVALYFSMRH
jgi:hypothetical protein